MKVFKYPLNLAHFDFRMPAGAKVLYVDLDSAGDLCLWAAVNPSPDHPTEARDFIVVGTGHDLPDGLEHLGSVVQGSFVWHVFEKV